MSHLCRSVNPEVVLIVTLRQMVVQPGLMESAALNAACQCWMPWVFAVELVPQRDNETGKGGRQSTRSAQRTQSFPRPVCMLRSGRRLAAQQL